LHLKSEEKLRDRANQAASVGSRPELLGNREMDEEEALARLKENNSGAEILASIARTGIAHKSRKLQFALLIHPRAPRHVLIPLLRGMFTFDLMKVALTPQVAADLKRAAEEQILLRLESLSLGERISLARRATARVVAGLLGDSDARVLSAALGNSRLRETSLTTALMRRNALPILFEIVSAHPIWSQNRELQILLLRSENTPMDAARRLAKHFSPQFLDQILPEARRSCL
jgi:hypothetical protein